jgi:hypothetical protein
MPWAIDVLDRLVFAGVGILVPDQQGDRGPRRLALEEAREDFDAILLLTGRGDLTLSDTATVEITLDILSRQLEACWAAIDHNADSTSVRFSPRGDAK